MATPAKASVPSLPPTPFSKLFDMINRTAVQILAANIK